MLFQPYRDGGRAAAVKVGVFQEFSALQPRSASPSVGGIARGGRTAFDNLLGNLERKFGTRAPKFVSEFKANVVPAVASVEAAKPVDTYLLGRDLPGAGGAQSSVRGPTNRFVVDDATGQTAIALSGTGEGTAAHEVGHALDSLGAPGFMGSYARGPVPFERRATQHATADLGGDHKDLPDLYRAYATYLQAENPVPVAPQEPMGAIERLLASRQAALDAARAEQAAAAQSLPASKKFEKHEATRLGAQRKAVAQSIADLRAQLADRGLKAPQITKYVARRQRQLLEAYRKQPIVGTAAERETLLQAKNKAEAEAKAALQPKVDEASKKLQRAEEFSGNMRKNNPKDDRRVKAERSLDYYANLEGEDQRAFQNWLDAKQVEIDQAFGPGAGALAVSPILEELARRKRGTS